MSYCQNCAHLYHPASPDGDYFCGYRLLPNIFKIHFSGVTEPDGCPGRKEKPLSDQDRIKALEEKVDKLHDLFVKQCKVNKELRANHVSLINQLNKILLGKT